MGVEIRKTIVVTVNGQPFVPEWIMREPEMEALRQFMRENKFPDDPQYSSEDFMADMSTDTQYTLPDIKEETMEYIRVALNCALS